jgi:hypothetical protein
MENLIGGKKQRRTMEMSGRDELIEAADFSVVGR